MRGSNVPTGEGKRLKCWNCQLDNRDGELVCARCGKPLFTGGISSTRKLDVDPTPTPLIGTTRFPEHTRLKIFIAGAKEPLFADIDEQLTFGRIGADVDLTPYGADELGVSRIHLILKRTEGVLTIQDRDSTNGTWVGTERLKPNTPYPFQDASHCWIGRMECIIYFAS